MIGDGGAGYLVEPGDLARIAPTDPGEETQVGHPVSESTQTGRTLLQTPKQPGQDQAGHDKGQEQQPDAAGDLLDVLVAGTSDVAEEGEAGAPEHPARHVVGQERGVMHVRHSGESRNQDP